MGKYFKVTTLLLFFSFLSSKLLLAKKIERLIKRYMQLYKLVKINLFPQALKNRISLNSRKTNADFGSLYILEYISLKRPVITTAYSINFLTNTFSFTLIENWKRVAWIVGWHWPWSSWQATICSCTFFHSCFRSLHICMFFLCNSVSRLAHKYSIKLVLPWNIPTLQPGLLMPIMNLKLPFAWKNRKSLHCQAEVESNGGPRLLLLASEDSLQARRVEFFLAAQGGEGEVFSHIYMIVSGSRTECMQVPAIQNIQKCSGFWIFLVFGKFGKTYCKVSHLLSFLWQNHNSANAACCSAPIPAYTVRQRLQS